MNTPINVAELIKELEDNTGLQTDEIQSQLQALLEHSPKIQTDAAFKKQLHDKLQTLIDLKNPQKKQSRFYSLKIVFPLVCSFGFVFGIFHIIDPNTQDISTQSYERELPVSETILSPILDRSDPEQEVDISSPQESSKRREVQSLPQSQGVKPSSDSKEIPPQTIDTPPPSTFSSLQQTQIQGDTERVDTSIIEALEQAGADMSAPESSGAYSSQDDPSAESNFGSMSDTAEPRQIDRSFEQACKSRSLAIVYHDDSSIQCMKGEKIICNQEKFLLGKCPFLE